MPELKLTSIRRCLNIQEWRLVDGRDRTKKEEKEPRKRNEGRGTKEEGQRKMRNEEGEMKDKGRLQKNKRD